ncbi:SpoIID/LytB domain-containing protein [Barnesiella viscericola]|uniref:SpoIID/LytB domain-containing protein n=1 Tax=Barnesiella viscericola TaxID=397865 RepID=A0A921MQJ8_9BACT|nr:SpoIID/LytB domain-containing protein [Barnesiella viscericola]HJG88709.1 SpoIID/LytB domain-containing protein [Barnesiella viscericola]
MKEPSVTVGILSGERLAFAFNDTYLWETTPVEGAQEVYLDEGRIVWNGVRYDQLCFTPQHPDGSFCLKGVTIGVKFHWERREDQTFRGSLRLVVDEGRITAINELAIEEYLLSVISSEMSATASLELLKSHAVISRSWLLAQIRKGKVQTDSKPVSTRHTADELIRWYDREDHRLFDVCADDHCQRYQGITRASTPLVGEAVRATRGEILTCDGTICDTRFSKCCGGVMERFSSCWEEIDPPYLVVRRDSRDELDFPDLRIEENARRWIETTPEAYCHTTDARILAQVLNNYDRETTDFYRWRVDYTQEELASLIQEKSGLDLGQIIDLRPVERGTSGRIVRLRIEGTRRAITIGKELEIRRTLSPSHLYSSAFVVDRQEMVDGIPRRFVLRGAGWGHGVGLCQIGAAVMGEQGYSYRQILLHYYAGATLEKIY